MDSYMASAKLRYIDDLALYTLEKPYSCTLPFRHVNGARRSNIATSEHQVRVHEMSKSNEPFSIDLQGFETVHYPSTINLGAAWDEETVWQKYIEECKILLKQCFGAEEVIVFDHMFRKRGITAVPVEHDEHQRLLPPSLNVHVDQTPSSARRRVQHHAPDQADALLNGRVRILNVWRPLFSPLEDSPLALCDYRSIEISDLVAADLPSPHYVGEMFFLRHNPNHHWWFRGSMEKEEAMIIKCYDSKAELGLETIARSTPHTSFCWQEGPQNARPRESIEVRALVFSSS